MSQAYYQAQIEEWSQFREQLFEPVVHCSDRPGFVLDSPSLGYTSEHIPGNRITNGVIRRRSRLPVRQSEMLLGLEWDQAEIKEVTR